MDHPDFSDTKPQQALDYLWSTLQAAGVASKDTEKAYITVREALNDRYLRPDVARMLAADQHEHDWVDTTTMGDLPERVCTCGTCLAIRRERP